MEHLEESFPLWGHNCGIIGLGGYCFSTLQLNTQFTRFGLTAGFADAPWDP